MISRSNLIWFSALLFLLMGAGAYFFIRVFPVLRDADRLSTRMEEMLVQRSELFLRPEGPPSESLLQAAREESSVRGWLLEEIEKNLKISHPPLLPEGAGRPGIYWLDTLKRKRAGITGRARQEGISIPAGLGFSDSLPSRDEVPGLLFKLYIVEEIYGLAADSGLLSISEIRIVDETRAARPGEREFFRDVPPEASGRVSEDMGRQVPGLEDIGVRRVLLELSAEAALADLFVFVNRLRHGSFLYVIEDMRLRAVEERRGAAGRRDGTERITTEKFLSVDLKLAMYYIPFEDAGEPAVDFPAETVTTGALF